MNYRELQAKIKELRNKGIVPKSFSLKQKKTVLMAEYERVSGVVVSPEASTDTDEVSQLKRRIKELEIENAKLKTELEIATTSVKNDIDDNKVDDLLIDEKVENSNTSVVESEFVDVPEHKQTNLKVESLNNKDGSSVVIEKDMKTQEKWDKARGDIYIAMKAFMTTSEINPIIKELNIAARADDIKYYNSILTDYALDEYVI